MKIYVLICVLFSLLTPPVFGGEELSDSQIKEIIRKAALKRGYLKIRTYPSFSFYIERVVEITIKPQSPDDKKFDELSQLLTKITAHKDHSYVTVDASSLSLKFKWKEELIETGYDSYAQKDNPEIIQLWEKVFKLIQTMLNEKLETQQSSKNNAKDSTKF